MHRRIAWAFALAAIIFLGGCSKNISPPTTTPVSGQVLFKGKPLGGVLVTFHPRFDMGAVKFAPSGLSNKEGRFTLSTAAPSDGAPPGEYVVTFSYPVVESDRKTGLEIEVDAWKGKYADPAHSRWPTRIDKGTSTLEPFRVE